MADVAKLEEPVIFIIDDDEAVRDSLRLLLETHGMEVEVYASTETFARSYRPRARQCLILDQHLRGMRTGLEFLASPERAAMRLPVILVTGRGDNEIKARALDAGVAAYLDKPIDATQLVATIDCAIAAARASGQVHHGVGSGALSRGDGRGGAEARRSPQPVFVGIDHDNFGG